MGSSAVALHRGVVLVHAVVNQPRISIVTPSYNQGEYLEATLRSVTSQGYPNLEYVVIDGASTDGSVDIIKRFAPDLSYWVSEPDLGHAHALNKGFAHTSGEIMCWINSSDLHYPWTLATVAEIFSQLPQVEWITGVPSQFDVEGRLRVVDTSSSLKPSINLYDVLAGDYRWIQQESVFWRRTLWERAGGQLDEGLRGAADFDLWLRFFRLATLYNVGTLLGGFRVHDDRLGETADERYEIEVREVYERFVSQADPRSLARARLVRLARPRRLKSLADFVARAGLLPWYRHPRLVFDFRRMEWKLQ